MRWERVAQLVALVAGVLLSIILVTMAVIALDDWVALVVLAAVVAGSLLARNLIRRRIPGGTVIEIDLEGGVVESIGSDPVSQALTRNSVVLRDVLDALHRAAHDDRVTGLVVRLGNGGIEIGTAQELREAVRRYRESGKTTVAYADTFGESGEATVDYYLASAFAQIYLQPMGGISIQGRLARARFLRGALDKLGIYPDFDHREEYKSAKYMFTETGFTEPHREALGSVVEDHFSQIVEGIAADRGLSREAVSTLIDRAPLTSEEAVASGLVDHVGHRDEAYAASGGNGLIYHHRYLRKAGRPHRKGDRIALIYGTGAIARGSSRFDPLTGGPSLGADDVAKAFRKATDSDKVKAIVFRVDSPGGSAVASEVVRREVVRAREAGKPVVVSMGNVAGSGGYWVATDADRIVAQPGTITGSIGVVFGKLVTGDAWARLGITFGQLPYGENAGFWSPQQKFSDGERERVQVELDDVYQRFISIVAAGRGLEDHHVQEIAKGRIWTGAQARDHGLIDELGGLYRAIDLAKEVAGIDAERPVRVKVYPERRALPIPRREDNSEPVRQGVGALVDLLLGISEAESGVQARMPDLHLR
jgi:protease-4